MLFPPRTPDYYNFSRHIKPGLTAAQRHRRQKKQFKRKMRRHDALLYGSFISPAAIFTARLGLLPRHLEGPYTKKEIRMYIDECNTVFYHSAWARRSDYLAVINGSSEIVLKLPRCLRAPKKQDLRQEELFKSDLCRLQNGYNLSIPIFRRWFRQGFKRYMYKVIEEHSIQRCGGEWAVMYPEEMAASFPSINFEKKNYRKWYLVQGVRDENGLLNEVRIFSSSYAPVFRMEIQLEKSAVVPEDCRNWWTRQDLPLPPHRMNLFEPVKELDDDGLRKVPGS